MSKFCHFVQFVFNPGDFKVFLEGPKRFLALLRTKRQIVKSVFFGLKIESKC